MLFLLRKIRRKLLTDNKVTTYLLYAIGEIFLVVVGILIAVQIGDWNEQKKTEAKITSLLGEVRDDLATDIIRANEVLNYYQEVDSIITLALNDKLTSEDYKQYPKRLSLLTTIAQHIKIHNNGYRKLMELSDNIHPKFQPIVDLLTEMYESQKYLVDMSDERMNLLTDQNYDHFAQTKPWYHKIRRGMIDDEIIDYYLNDPFYKNKLDTYQTYSVGIYSQRIYRFAQNAHDAYRLIHNELETATPLPDFIAQHQISPTPELIKPFPGVYEIIEAPRDNYLIGVSVIIKEFQDHLTITVGDYRTHELFFLTENKLYSGYGVIVTMDLDAPSDSTILDFNTITADFRMLKIN
jgi:hypothetical protein